MQAYALYMVSHPNCVDLVSITQCGIYFQKMVTLYRSQGYNPYLDGSDDLIMVIMIM
jgi:hypothetical protein